MAISQANLKNIRQLAESKHRKGEKRFTAEGHKTISDLQRFGYTIVHLYAVDEAFEAAKFINPIAESVSKKEMDRMSGLSTPPGILGVFVLPDILIDNQVKTGVWSLVLDGIKDPGNMGTILRTAHWFGITDIYLCNACVDIFNPKVVQSSMGSLAAIKFRLIDSIEHFIQYATNKKHPLYATDMKGKALTNYQKFEPCSIIMGSESHGISQAWEKVGVEKLSIPGFYHPLLESLNVAVATGIILYHAKISEAL